ncbi:receptor L domain protein [Ancylostoma ceylanicum]|uniref:Receptor L domain protein n=1 Tax=Ancylostoma ceylanicum TaxID=53326 RepID=A0A0D6LPB5_9BILA|nr:receptor L domain protein [Ancylostoma ceylanicum]
MVLQAITSVQGCLIINGTRIETAALQQITEVTPDQKFCDCLVNEANSNTNCESVVGDVNIADLSSDTWNRIKEVHGTVHVEKTSVSDINHLENLKIVGWKTPALVISKNKNLIDISALLTMSIESKYKPIEIKDNPNICHAIDEEQKLKQWLSGMKSSVKFSRKCR